MKKKIIGIIAVFVVIGIIITIFSGNDEKTDDEKLAGIESIVLQNNYGDIDIKANSSFSKEGYVSATITRNSDISFDELNTFVEFVINDESIAAVESIAFDENTQYSFQNSVTCTIVGVNNGNTIGYFQSKDGKIKSKQVTIHVSGITNENEKTRFEGLVNNPLEDAIHLTEEIGYTATYIHDQSNMDFTESISTLETDNYIVLSCEKIDTEKKTVEIHINTKENIENNQEAEKLEKALSAKLSKTNAWNAINAYGNELYPYGFNVKEFDGYTVEAKDENTWFIKATAKIANEYNTKSEIVFEAYVTGTNENPEVTEFNVY